MDGDGEKDNDLNDGKMLREEEEALLPNRINAIDTIEDGGEMTSSGSMKGDSSTVETLSEENKKLKAANGELSEENKELKKTLKVTRKALGPHWKTKVAEMQREEVVRETLRGIQKMLLKDMLIEKEQLKGIIVNLKNSVSPLSRTVREKDDEVRLLTKRVAKLKAERAKNLVNLKDDTTKKTEEANRKDAVDVFPEEVWRIILGHVSDQKDLWNCYNACQLFKDIILTDWTTGFMLGQALPHMYRHLTTSELLGCRAVSKGWNAVVDSFLEDHPSLRPHNEEAADPRDLNFVCPLKEKRISTRNYFRFCYEEMFALQMSNFPVALGRNPFVGRCVSVSMTTVGELVDDDEEEPSQDVWWDRLYKFLEAYGKEIWYLHVHFSEDPPFVLMEEKVTEFSTVKVFQLVPNLRKLYLFENSVPLGTVNPRSIPDAPTLESIWADDVICSPVLDGYLQRFHLQLRHLVVVSGVWYRARHLQWPNLTELHLSIWGGESMEDHLRDLDGARMPQLTKLTLTVGHAFRDLTCEKLSEVVNQLASTSRLTTLCLYGSFISRGMKKCSGKSLPTTKLCHLKNLEIGNSCSAYNVALLCFPLLENLNVFYSETDFFDIYIPARGLQCLEDCKSRCPHLNGGWQGPEDQAQLIDVNSYIYDGDVYKSNIWELLPLLKVFTFQWDVYTREGYEAYLRSRGGGASSSSV